MAEGGIVDKDAANRHKMNGNKFLSEAKYQEAIEEYTLGISIDPKNHVLYSNRSAAHAKMENYAGALQDAEEVVKLSPGWVKGYSRKGSALQFLGRFEEAKEVYMKGLEIDSSNEQLKKGVKECDAELDGPTASQPLGNPFANLETIMPRLREDERTKHFESDPEYMEMLKKLGEDPMNMQNYLRDDRLRLTLSALLGFDLEKPEDMNFNEPPFVDEDMDDEEGMAEAQPKIKEIPDTEPKSTEEPDVAKVAEMKLTDIEQAKREKEIGTSFLRKDEFDTAHEHYDAAIRCNPLYIEAYSNKALAYQKQKLPEKVREVSQKVIDIGNEHGGDKKIIAKAYMRIGQAYFDEGKFDIALENFQRCMDENDDKTAAMQAEAQKKAEECRKNISRQQGS